MIAVKQNWIPGMTAVK